MTDNPLDPSTVTPAAGRRLRPVLLAVGVVAALVATFGAVLVVRDGDANRPATVAVPAGTTPAPSTTDAATVPAVRPTLTTSATPTPAPTATPVTTPATDPGVRGRVVDVDGRPVAGATVTLTDARRADGGPADREARTDARGEYVLHPAPKPVTYTLDVTQGTLFLYAQVELDGTPRTLPDAVLWSPGTRLTFSGTTATLRYRHAPPSLGRVVGYPVSVADPVTGYELVHLYDEEDGEATFDARLVEDVPVRAFASARLVTALDDTVVGEYHDTRGALRPGSRGRRCFEHGPGDRSVTNTEACRRAVDGNLRDEWRVSPPGCAEGACESYVGVDLGGVHRVGLVHVRGCLNGTVETSVDGVTWEPFDVDVAGCVLELDVEARYVRVGDASGPRFTELSVWYAT